MSYRFMRLIVFFDLPVETALDRKDYRRFRKFLVKDGFIMMQKSVYVKLALNTSVANAQIKRIKDNKPKDGIVEILTITEKQFSRIDYIIGSKTSNIEDSDERLIVL